MSSRIESVNVNACKYLTTLPEKQIREQTSDCESEKDWKTTYKNLTQFNYKVIDTAHNYSRKLGIDVSAYIDMPVLYKVTADGLTHSTKYSVQDAPRGVRALICQMNDYDMDAAHFKILKYYCKKHQIECPLLTSYCDDKNKYRLMAAGGEEDNHEKALELGKERLAKALNCDKPQGAKKQWIYNFSVEIGKIREQLLEIKEYEPIFETGTDNKKNPKASQIHRIITTLQGNILKDVIEEFSPVMCVEMYDGFMTDKEIDIADLNEYTKEYGITWSNKIPTQVYHIPDGFQWEDPRKAHLADDVTPERQAYLDWRADFEGTRDDPKNCVINAPYIQYVRVHEEKGVKCYNYYNKDSIVQIYNNCEKFTIQTHKGPVEKKGILIWLEDPDRMTFERKDFMPYNKNKSAVPDYLLNTFKPFPRSLVGDADCATGEDVQSYMKTYMLPLMLQLCENNKELLDFLIKWIAHLLQHPEQLAETVVVLKGEEGTGKNTLERFIKTLMKRDEYCLNTEKQDSVFGKFNSVMHEKLMVWLNEASNQDSVKYAESLKQTSTEGKIQIQFKGKDIQTFDNFIRVIIASNNSKPVLMKPGSRRFFVVKATDFYIGAKAQHYKEKFFTPLNEGFRNDKLMNGVFRWFMNIDLTEYRITNIPQGKLSESMQVSNIPPMVEFLWHTLHKFPDCARYNSKKDLICISNPDMLYCYKSWATQRYSSTYMNPSNLTSQLSEVSDKIQQKKVPDGTGTRKPCYVIPVADLIAKLDQKYMKGNHATQCEDMDDDDFNDFASPGQFNTPPKKVEVKDVKKDVKDVKKDVKDVKDVKKDVKDVKKDVEVTVVEDKVEEEIPKTINSELEKEYKAMPADALRDLAKSLGISHIENRKRKTKNTLILDILTHS